MVQAQMDVEKSNEKRRPPGQSPGGVDFFCYYGAKQKKFVCFIVTKEKLESFTNRTCVTKFFVFTEF
jgi:hypothetical protein